MRLRTPGRLPRGRDRPSRNGASLVLDIVYVLGVIALFVIIGLFATAVDRV